MPTQPWPAPGPPEDAGFATQIPAGNGSPFAQLSPFTRYRYSFEQEGPLLSPFAPPPSPVYMPPWPLHAQYRARGSPRRHHPYRRPLSYRTYQQPPQFQLASTVRQTPFCVPPLSTQSKMPTTPRRMHLSISPKKPSHRAPVKVTPPRRLASAFQYCDPLRAPEEDEGLAEQTLTSAAPVINQSYMQEGPALPGVHAFDSFRPRVRQSHLMPPPAPRPSRSPFPYI